MTDEAPAIVAGSPGPPSTHPVDRRVDRRVEWHRLAVPQVAERLDVDAGTGLSDTEVAVRFERHGPNELAETERRAAWKRFADQFRDTMVYILAGAAVVSAAVGDLKDPIVIGIVLLVNAVMGFVQENKADDALAALKSMLETIVRVRRDGRVGEVPGRELVPGDVVLLEAGDRVPADGRFVMAASLSVDESTLTGESLPVDKTDGLLGPDLEGQEVPLADRCNLGYMNSTVVRGRGEMVVTETGMDTEIGRLAGMLGSAEEPPTPLQEQIHVLGKRLAAIAFVAVVVVFGVALYQADEINSETFSEALLNSVALAVAAIPEGLPAVVTVTLAIGVGRMAKRNAIVKRLASVETLGSTTVICSDKTGTLTLNQMTAVRFYAAGRLHHVTGVGYEPEGEVSVEGADGPLDETGLDRIRHALLAGALCNDAHLREEDGETRLVGDPTEGALVVLAAKVGIDPERARREHPRIAEVPFDSATKYMATLNPHPEDPGRSVLLVKGAPDVVTALCSAVDGPEGPEPIDERWSADLVAANESLGGEGLRVLAVARRELDVAAERHPGDLAPELHDLRLEAYVGILDPARPEVIDAIAECATAGIGVKMITGDHATTAGAIARELGIPGRVVTGADLDRISDEDLPSLIDDIGVCARVSPEHKVRVVKALQHTGNVVAMTGDGVNDAASLKQAEIGVAMGVTGTEVTKEAGDMILADDNFATIVAAVERGRAIYDNIVTFVRFQLTTNVSAIFTILFAQLAGMGALFNAIQILFVNIIADGPPAMAIGVDPPKPGVMDRPPRHRRANILTGRRLARIVVSAIVITIGTISLFVAFRGPDDVDRDVAMTMAFSTFVLYQLVNSFCVRAGDRSVFSRYSLANRPLLYALVAVIGMQVLIVHVPFLQGVFTTVPLTLGQWAWVLVTPLSLLVFEELRKLVVGGDGTG
jgi:P-type Ca2+ transporter type 2C